MNTIFNITLFINPKNKIYKTFQKRGFIKDNYSIKLESFRVPLIGEKINLIQYNDTLTDEINTFLSNRNIPVVFEVEDIITTNFKLTHKINGIEEYKKSTHVYLKVNEIENYNVYGY
jgi:hypothetical protein